MVASSPQKSTSQYSFLAESKNKKGGEIKNDLVIEELTNHVKFLQELTIDLILQHLPQPKYFLQSQLSKEHNGVSKTKWI